MPSWNLKLLASAYSATASLIFVKYSVFTLQKASFCKIKARGFFAERFLTNNVQKIHLKQSSSETAIDFDSNGILFYNALKNALFFC